MIVAIEGEVVHKEPTVAHIKTHGLTYEVLLSLQSSNSLEVGKSISLYTTRIIREDADILVGFATKAEKRMFDTLLKINGVGVKVALAICSTFTPQNFASVVASKDVAMLKQVPGIGPKAASRILVELADFIIDDASDTNASLGEAIMALESLGFKKEAIKKALQGATGDTGELVKAALKKLQKL